MATSTWAMLADAEAMSVKPNSRCDHRDEEEDGSPSQHRLRAFAQPSPWQIIAGRGTGSA